MLCGTRTREGQAAKVLGNETAMAIASVYDTAQGDSES
ncbi:hypothetical protein S7335_333 [Synechococcus sp. PCC 7335]|nr:hypothetical protein S7335_333 [Synechococcus sp. PCC 7335]